MTEKEILNTSICEGCKREFIFHQLFSDIKSGDLYCLNCFRAWQAKKK